MKTLRIPRHIKYIVVHCSGSSETQTVQGLLDYWKNEKKWTAPGYHYAVERDGEVIQLRDENNIANGVTGHNQHAIHVGWIGGISRKGKEVNNITKVQEEALFNKIIELSVKYPEAEILGHRDFSKVKKSCPLFDVKSWLESYTPNIELAA